MRASGPALLDAARALAPRVEAGAEEAERRRDLPKELVEALASAGVFQMLVPAELGGGGLGPLEAIPVIEELARQDGSTGWCAGTAAIQSALVALRADEALVRGIFRDPRAVCAGGLAPMARARPADGGGYRIRGRFSFGSGVRFATTIVGGCLVEDDAGQPVVEDGAARMLAVCLPPADVTIHDNWHTSGLEATASCEYSVDETRVVPEAQAFPLWGAAPRGGRMGRLPMLSVAYIGHLSFALGVGRRALEEVREYARTRQRLRSDAVLAHRATFQRQLAEHEARLDAARLLALRAFGGLWDETSGGEVSLARRADVAQAAVHAAEVAAGVTDFALRSGGASSVYRSQRIQRCFRDMYTARQHIAVGDEIWERVGRARLGLATPDELL